MVARLFNSPDKFLVPPLEVSAFYSGPRASVGTMGQGNPEYLVKSQDKYWVNPRESAPDLAG
jgi:hypothetical protein